MKTAMRLGALLFLTLALAACVAGSAESGHAASGGVLSEFLLGLWHGIIGPIMVIVELINRFAPHALPWTVKFYEVRAAGPIYDIGFYLGLVGSPLLAGARWRRG